MGRSTPCTESTRCRSSSGHGLELRQLLRQIGLPLDPSAERPTIGLVVLARDEEETIGRCLSSVPWDQAVVVDMASADATANVAGALGAAVVSVPPMRRF